MELAHLHLSNDGLENILKQVVDLPVVERILRLHLGDHSVQQRGAQLEQLVAAEHVAAIGQPEVVPAASVLDRLRDKLD